MYKSIAKGRLILVTAIFILTAFTFTGTSCRLLHRDSEAIALKKKKASDKKDNAEYDKALKKHYKNQSKGAKKMMKHTKKSAAVFNKPMKRKHTSKKKCY